MGFHSLQIGKSALLAANYGLEVTGQNLSNVNTTGYSRQTLNQKGAVTSASGAALGSGVTVKSVTRVVDLYAEKQLRQATSTKTYYSALDACYTNVQNIFSELSVSGGTLAESMDSFRESLSELSTHLETLSNRTTVLEDAMTMTSRFNEISASLKEYRASINGEVESSVKEINNLITVIAQLNRSIVSAESAGLSDSTANDLRDERGEALRQLSELMNVDVTEEANGSCIVSINGRSLVYFDQVYEVGIRYETNGGIAAAIPVFSSDGYPLKADSGTLASQMEIRDTILTSYIEDLDQLAATYTWDFNRIYSQSRGTEPFSSMTSLYAPIDPAVALNQLQYKTGIPDGTFQIVNGNLEMVVVNKETGQETTVNIEIDLDGRLGPDGEPDMILWDPANPDASNSFINRLQIALDAAVPGAFKVSIDNEYKVTIDSLSDAYGFAFASDTSGILAALGLNVLFTGHTAGDIGINMDLASSPQLMGVATGSESGDNTGILNMLEVLDSGVDRLGGLDAASYYQNMIGRLGGEAARVATQKTVAVDILNRAFNQRESVSGVSEDEEALNLIAYQRAYQSAARFISVVDGLYDTLLAM